MICKSKWCREVVSRKHKTSRSGRKWFICTLIKDAVIITASFIIEIFICTYFSLCLALVWYNVSHTPSLYIRTNQALIYICIFVFVYIQVLTEQQIFSHRTEIKRRRKKALFNCSYRFNLFSAFIRLTSLNII